MKKIFSKLDLNADLEQVPSKREKIIFSAAIFIFLVVFLRTCWSPSVTAISEIKGEIDSLSEQNGYLSQVISSAGTGSEGGEVQGDALKQVQYSGWAKKFADDPDTILVNNFSNPSMLRDIKIGNMSFQEDPSPGSGIIKKSFKLSLLGSFTSVGSYLVKMESLPLLLSLEAVNIRTASGLGDASKVSVDIEGIAYGWK